MRTTVTLLRLATCLGLAVLWPAATASANDYLPTSGAAPWTYVSDHGGAVVESHVIASDRGWNRFSRFASLSDQWVWTSPTNNRIYLGTSSGYKLLVDLDGRVGGSFAVDLGCPAALIRIEAKGLTHAVPAGTFADVIRLGVVGPCSDVGATEIWFARGVGIIQWSQHTLFGNVTFKLVDGGAAVARQLALPAAARDTYADLSLAISDDIWAAIDGLPETLLDDPPGFGFLAPTELSAALPIAIRGALYDHGLGSISDSHVEQLVFVLAVDVVDLVTAQELQSNELGMIRLQSALAARSQALELIANMLAAHASATSTIVGKIN